MNTYKIISLMLIAFLGSCAQNKSQEKMEAPVAWKGNNAISTTIRKLCSTHLKDVQSSESSCQINFISCQNSGYFPGTDVNDSRSCYEKRQECTDNIERRNTFCSCVYLETPKISSNPYTIDINHTNRDDLGNLIPGTNQFQVVEQNLPNNNIERNFTWTFKNLSGYGASEFSVSESGKALTANAWAIGDYEVCVYAKDHCQKLANSCKTFSVVPNRKLHIELTWAEEHGDMDLHFLPANEDSFHGENVNYFINENPDWSDGFIALPDESRENDPSLDVDDQEGYGPENITLNNFIVSEGKATVGVNYYRGYGSYTPTVRIFVDQVLRFEKTKILTGGTWRVANISVEEGPFVKIEPIQ